MDQALPLPTGPAVGTDPTRPTPGFCRCGCGEPTPRRYRPGHDAKHHSTLAAALHGEWRQANRAADLLADLGWAGYADPAALRAVAYRASNGLARQILADVATWQVTPDGQHHSHRSCPALTAQARAAGGLNPTTRRAADSWLTFEANTPALAHRLAHSWDQCTECTTDVDRLTEAEHRAAVIGAIAEPTRPEDRKIWKKTPTAWTVAADLAGAAPVLVTWNHTTGAITRRAGLPAPVAG